MEIIVKLLATLSLVAFLLMALGHLAYNEGAPQTRRQRLARGIGTASGYGFLVLGVLTAALWIWR